jgi:hypothetical protein
MLVNVEGETRVFTVGLVDRVCVIVRADAVRAIPVVRLPASARSPSLTAAAGREQL